MTDNETVLYLSSNELRTLRDALRIAAKNRYLNYSISEGERCKRLHQRINNYCDREPLALARIEPGIIKVEQDQRKDF